jgi:hypothetical protein
MMRVDPSDQLDQNMIQPAGERTDVAFGVIALPVSTVCSALLGSTGMHDC